MLNNLLMVIDDENKVSDISVINSNEEINLPKYVIINNDCILTGNNCGTIKVADLKTGVSEEECVRMKEDLDSIIKLCETGMSDDIKSVIIHTLNIMLQVA